MTTIVIRAVSAYSKFRRVVWLLRECPLDTSSVPPAVKSEVKVNNADFDVMPVILIAFVTTNDVVTSNVSHSLLCLSFQFLQFPLCFFKLPALLVNQNLLLLSCERLVLGIKLLLLLLK